MNSLRKALYTLFASFSAAILVSTAVASEKNVSWDSAAALRKADYAFAQAATANALDSFDLAFRLADYASSLNPGDVTIATLAATLRLPLVTDSLETERIYSLILRQFFEHPDDYENGLLAANAAEQLRRIDDLTHIWETLDSVFPSRQDIAPNLSSAYLMKYYITRDTAAFDRAMSIYNRLESGMGKDPGLSSYKIRAFQIKGDTAGIISEIKSLTEALPYESAVWLLAGQTYQAERLDSVRELEFFQRAVQADSTNGQALLALAEYYQAHGDSLAYRHEMRRALLSPGLDPSTKTDLLSSYLRFRGQDSVSWPEIRQDFDSLTVINPGEADIHTAYGAFLDYIEEPKGALEQFIYSLSLEPSNERVRTSVMYHQLNLSDTTAAIATAREGLKISPSNLLFPIMAASLLSQQGHISDAFTVIDSTDISEVNNPQAVASFLTTAADIYQMADSISLALTTYDRAIALAPDFALPYNNASYGMATHGGDLDKALRYARYAVLSDVDNPTYLDTYAWAYFKLKNYPEAKSYIDKALVHAGLVSDSTLNDSVKVEVTELVPPELDSTASDTGDNTAIDATDDDSGDLPAVPGDAESDEPYSGSAEILEHAGDIYFMSGLPDQAVTFWERAAALAPDNELLARKVKNRTYFYK